MRTTLLASTVAVAMAEGSAASGGAPHLTFNGAYEFVSDSVFLTKDIASFVSGAAFTIGWEYIPPNVQGQITEQTDKVKAQVDTFRLKNGIPTPAQMWTDAKSEYQKKVQPLVEKAQAAIGSFTGKAAEVAKMFVGNFEKAYPEHAGKLSDNIFDLLLVAWLCYYIFGYFWRAFCYFACCGMCARRASAKAEAPKIKKAAPTKKSR